MIRLTVRDVASERVLSLSTIALIHAQVPPDCTRPDGNCNEKDKPAEPGNVAMVAPAGQGGQQ